MLIEGRGISWPQALSRTQDYWHYSGLNPIYIPVGEGYCGLTRITTQAGATLRFPFPRRPYFSNINCLYAALRKEDVLVSSRSFLISALFLIHSSSTSGSRHSFSKRLLVVIHFLSPQHLFSISWAMAWQCLHLHQSGAGSPSGGCEPPLPVGVVSSLSSSKLFPPLSSSSSSSSMIRRLSTYSILPTLRLSALTHSWRTMLSSKVDMNS